jgi:hypothetical protein
VGRYDDVIQHLTDKIAAIIEWGCLSFNIPILIVETEWSISNRYTVSSIAGSNLKFTSFFALRRRFKIMGNRWDFL